MLCFSEQGTVRNLQVTEETTNSFRVSWQAAPGPVIRYRLTYVPVSGTGEILAAQTIGTETTIVLEELFPITTYRVSVSAEYSSGVGDEMQVDGTTKEGESWICCIRKQLCETCVLAQGICISVSHIFVCFQSVALHGTSVSLTRPYPQWNWHGRLLQEMLFSTALPSNLPRAVTGRRYLSREILPRLCWRTSSQPLNMSCLWVLATLLVWVNLFLAQEQP